MAYLAFIVGNMVPVLRQLANWNAGDNNWYSNDSIMELRIGYHRLWSHRSFTAKLPLRIVLAAMGTLGFQGSIRYFLFLSMC